VRDQLTARLRALTSELAAGQQLMADLEARQADLEGRRARLRDTLLRISGAIQVLEEELGQRPRPRSARQLQPEDMPVASPRHPSATA